jgi:hypothetical protein
MPWGRGSKERGTVVLMVWIMDNDPGGIRIPGTYEEHTSPE